MQHMLRTICKSRTYQASITTNQWNQDDDINFSHAMARRLPAEVLYDAIQRTTGSVSHLPGVPAGYRATQLPDVGLKLPSGFFEVFGRPARESACECERSSGMMLGPVMTLVNGPTIADAIADPQNDLTRLVASEPNDAKVVDEVFMRILSRPPQPTEIEAGVEAMHASGGEHARLVAELAQREAALDAKQAAWEAEQKGIAWTVAEPLEMTSSMNATFAKQPDNSVLVEGPTARGSYTIKLATDLADVTGIRLELLADAKLPSSGPGRAPNGNVTLTEIKATAAPKDDPAKAIPLTFASATADFSQEGYAIAGAIDGKPETHWAISPQTGKDHAGVFEIKEDLNLAGGCLLTLTLDQQYDERHTMGKFRVAVTNAKRPLSPSTLPEKIAPIVALAPEARSDAQKAELAAYYHALDPEWNRLTKSVATSAEQQKNERLTGIQDLAWALINSPAFLFNR